VTILGIDFSTKNIAYAVLVDDKFLEWENYEYTDLADLFSYGETLLDRVQPWFVAIEGLFLSVNPRILIELANVQGIIKLLGQKFNKCDPIVITPDQAKRAIGIDLYHKPYRGSTPKEKKEIVTKIINSLFGVKCPSHHIADAMAVAWSAWQEIKEVEKDDNR
jgi:Holliday junction resolvasome RuvABC endonuclease subunit